MSIVTLKAQSPWGRSEAAADWCRENGIEPNDTYRVDIDTKSMTALVYQYARNEEGHFYMDETTGEFARRGPFLVAIKTLPDVVSA